MQTGIDLFCGLGGFSFAMQMAGVRPVLGVDSWPDASEAYSRNFPGAKAVCADLFDAEFQEKLVADYGGKADIVCGGPPCQPFSVLNRTKRVGSEGPLVFFRLALDIRPSLILMEEVPDVARHAGLMDGIRVLAEERGYVVDWAVLNAADHGVAQTRRRLFVAAYPYGFSAPALFDIPKAVERVPLSRVLPPPDESQEVTTYAAEMIRERRSYNWHNGYNELDESGQAPALTTQFNQPGCWPSRRSGARYYHVSDADAAAIQSLPQDVKLPEKRLARRKALGNAVPPKMAAAVLRYMLRR